MYKIIVEEQNWKKAGNILAEESCRISALSSADFCLRDREELHYGQICWKGSAADIRRLFEAERLNSASLERLDKNKEYTVRFQGRCLRICA